MTDKPYVPTSADESIVFVGDESGPEELVAFFEDDGETGYLYLSDRSANKIIGHLQIYTDSAKLGVHEGDVKVIWSVGHEKCGVSIWGGMRGIIDVRNQRQGRAMVEDRNTPPISDVDWLRGFDLQ